jgi:hypothetical protein
VAREALKKVRSESQVVRIATDRSSSHITKPSSCRRITRMSSRTTTISTAQEAHRVERSASHAHVLAAGAPGSVIPPTRLTAFLLVGGQEVADCGGVPSQSRRRLLFPLRYGTCPHLIVDLASTNEEGATWSIRNS